MAESQLLSRREVWNLLSGLRLIRDGAPFLSSGIIWRLDIYMSYVRPRHQQHRPSNEDSLAASIKAEVQRKAVLRSKSLDMSHKNVSTGWYEIDLSAANRCRRVKKKFFSCYKKTISEPCHIVVLLGAGRTSPLVLYLDLPETISSPYFKELLCFYYSQAVSIRVGDIKGTF